MKRLHTIEQIDADNGPGHDLTHWFAVRDEELRVIAYTPSKQAAIRIARLADGVLNLL